MKSSRSGRDGGLAMEYDRRTSRPGMDSWANWPARNRSGPSRASCRARMSWRGAMSVVVEDAGGHAGVDADPLVGERRPPVVGGEDGLEVGHGEAPAEQLGDVVEADLEVAGVGLELQVGHAVGDPQARPE